MNPDVEAIKQRKSTVTFYAVLWGTLAMLLLAALFFAALLAEFDSGGASPEMSWVLVALVLGVLGALVGLIRCLIVAGQLESQLTNPSETR
jgi:membrane associated rhomboid family serine protease